MKWFRRKPKKFDYAAIRIGNVYVLPPDEDDVREFRQKRRKELTRRGFIVAGIGVALGAVALPFLPGKRNELDPSMLFSIDPATANPALLKQLCLYYYQHPEAKVRFQCARFMAVTTQDKSIKSALWKLIRSDPDEAIRSKALKSLIRHRDPADIGAIAQHYQQTPAIRPVVDNFVENMEYRQLQNALGTWMVK